MFLGEVRPILAPNYTEIYIVKSQMSTNSTIDYALYEDLWIRAVSILFAKIA